jgi:hypothetical protein
MTKLIIKNKYGIIPDEILNSKNLSLAAKGLYGYLQSKPDGWKFSINRMSFQLKEGKDAIRKAVLELEKFGLLKRTPTKDKDGKWNGYDYELFGKLAENPLAENPTTANPSTDLSDTHSKTDNSKTDSSKTDSSIINNNGPENEKIAFKKQINALSDINILATGKVAGEKKVEENILSDKERKKLISLFKDVNPNYEILFERENQADALRRLAKKFGVEKLEAIIKALPMIINLPYAPRITTPIQLENKLGELKTFYNQQKNKINKLKSKVGIITKQENEVL